MEKKGFLYVFLAFLVVVLASCSRLESERHKLFMKGQILEVTGNTAFLCIGSKDAAEVGDRFTVYKFTRVGNPNPEEVERPSYKREVAGKIKIIEVFEEHMAKAIILSGDVKPNYFIEMEE